MVLHVIVETRHVSGRGGLRKQACEIQSLRFPVGEALPGVEQVCAAYQVVELADAQLRHDLAHFFGDKEEIVDHVFRLAAEFFAQHRVLRGYTHRAGVEVAFAHHDAAFDHQRRGRETEFIGAEQGANRHVAAGFHLAIGLHPDARTQAVQDQGLLCFCQANLPR